MEGRAGSADSVDPAAAVRRKRKSVEPPILPIGWTREKQGNNHVYFGPERAVLPTCQGRKKMGSLDKRCGSRPRARSVAEAWDLARQEQARRADEAAREQVAREQMERAALPFLAEAALRREEPEFQSSEPANGQDIEPGGERGEVQDAEQPRRAACTTACGRCRKGASMCFYPDFDGHLQRAEASCPSCSGKRCSKGKRPDLRRRCLQPGKNAAKAGWKHWPAAPAAIVRELSAPVANMGLVGSC